MKIEELDFTVRTYNVLKHAGIDTVEQLREKTDDDLYRLRNVGGSVVAEIRSKLGGHCLTIADKIRAMSDEELCDTIFRLIYHSVDPAKWFCTNKKKCGEVMDAEKEIPDEWCKECLLEKLREPVPATRPATMADEDKQHSGLIEED